jgi:hypothetical protein
MKTHLQRNLVFILASIFTVLESVWFVRASRYAIEPTWIAIYLLLLMPVFLGIAVAVAFFILAVLFLILRGLRVELGVFELPFSATRKGQHCFLALILAISVATCVSLWTENHSPAILSLVGSSILLWWLVFFISAAASYCLLRLLVFVSQSKQLKDRTHGVPPNGE